MVDVGNLLCLRNLLVNSVNLGLNVNDLLSIVVLIALARICRIIQRLVIINSQVLHLVISSIEFSLQLLQTVSSSGTAVRILAVHYLVVVVLSSLGLRVISVVLAFNCRDC